MVRPRRQFPEVKDQKPLLSYKGHHISELVWMDEHFWPGKKMRGKCQIASIWKNRENRDFIFKYSPSYILTTKEIRMIIFFYSELATLSSLQNAISLMNFQNIFFP